MPGLGVQAHVTIVAEDLRCAVLPAVTAGYDMVDLQVGGCGTVGTSAHRVLLSFCATGLTAGRPGWRRGVAAGPVKGWPLDRGAGAAVGRGRSTRKEQPAPVRSRSPASTLLARDALDERDELRYNKGRQTPIRPRTAGILPMG